MSYTQTLEIVAAELCEYSTKMIRMNYNRGLRWAAGRGNLEFADAYQYIFKKYFKDEIDNQTWLKLQVAGRSIGFLIEALYDSEIEVDGMIRIVNTYLTAQVKRTRLWCSELSDPEVDEDD